MLEGCKNKNYDFEFKRYSIRDGKGWRSLRYKYSMLAFGFVQHFKNVNNEANRINRSRYNNLMY